MTPVPQRPRVLVLSGGLIHLVNQLAVVASLPEARGQAVDVGLVLTGVLTWDPQGLAAQHRAIGRWLEVLRQRDPRRYGTVRLVSDPEALRPGDWDLACLNNLWQESQRALALRLAIPTLVVCGDGLGLYYRTARELRALLPSLLGRPIPEPGWQVHYSLRGPQPRWHRPPPVPLAAARPPLSADERPLLFAALVASQAEDCRPLVMTILEPRAGAAGAETADRPGRPLWLSTVPNLAHQFPERRIPVAVLERWLDQLRRRAGFDPGRDRLVLIDHPKAPPGGSFGPELPAAVTGPIRSAVPVEVLVRALEAAAPGRPIVVAGLTSALYGVRSLTGAAVLWLGLGPLWRHNPFYRRRPLEFLHRLVRVRRMAWLTRRLPAGVHPSSPFRC